MSTMEKETSVAELRQEQIRSLLGWRPDAKGISVPPATKSDT